MPLPASSKPQIRDVITHFFGVNLRSDITDLGEGEFAKGINVDLYETPGVILSRRGFSIVFEDLAEPIRQMILAQGFLFAIGADTLYVDGISESTSLDPDTRASMVEFRGLNSPDPEVFIANGNMFRYSSRFGNWGIAGPLAAPSIVAGTGSLTGDYNAVYTYARKVGNTVVHESNPSPSPSAVTLASEGLDVTVVASSDADVNAIRVYRTQAGGSTFLFDTEITNAAQTVTLTQADGALGAQVESDNNVPAQATLVHVLRDRLWTNDLEFPSRLRYTKRFFPESQPASNFIDIGSTSQEIQAITSINGVLIAFTETTKFRIVEQLADVDAIGGGLPFIGGPTASFVAIELPSSRGCVAPDAVVSTGFGIIYPTKEGVFITDGTAAPETLLSAKIQSVFLGKTAGGISPINFERESQMVAAFHRGRYYLSYASTASADGRNDTTAILDMTTREWYFWNVGFTSLYFDDVNNIFYGGRDRTEAADAGGIDAGTIDEIEIANRTVDGVPAAATETITSTFSTSDRSGGDDMLRKLFIYARVNAVVDSGDTLTVSFYTDNTLRKTFTITGDQTRTLLRLPSGSRGFTWRMECSFTGSNRMEFHGAEAQFKSLVPS